MSYASETLPTMREALYDTLDRTYNEYALAFVVSGFITGVFYLQDVTTYKGIPVIHNIEHELPTSTGFNCRAITDEAELLNYLI